MYLLKTWNYPNNAIRLSHILLSFKIICTYHNYFFFLYKKHRRKWADKRKQIWRWNLGHLQMTTFWNLIGFPLSGNKSISVTFWLEFCQRQDLLKVAISNTQTMKLYEIGSNPQIIADLFTFTIRISRVNLIFFVRWKLSWVKFWSEAWFPLTHFFPLFHLIPLTIQYRKTFVTLRRNRYDSTYKKTAWQRNHLSTKPIKMKESKPIKLYAFYSCGISCKRFAQDWLCSDEFESFRQFPQR